MRLGVFAGYATQIEKGIRRIEASLPDLSELAIGGTAVGTGLNRHPRFPRLVCARLTGELGFAIAKPPTISSAGPRRLRRRQRRAEGGRRLAFQDRQRHPVHGLGPARAGRDPPAGAAARLLDHAGQGEPVLCEVTTQVAAQVIGNDAAVTTAGATGNFELNVVIPVMVRNLLDSVTLTAHRAPLRGPLRGGIQANVQRCRDLAESSDMIVTGLAPYIGYDAAAALAKEARKTGRTIRQLASERKLLSPRDLERALDLAKMTRPGITAGGGSGG